MKKKRNISKITIAFVLALSVILTFVSRYFLTSAINKKGVYASESKSRIHYIILDSDVVASTNSEAIVIESNGHFGLIDASNYSEEYKEYTDRASGKQVIKYLEGLGATHLDFIIGSHAHSDHIGGILDIVNDTGLINEDTIYIYKEYIFNSKEEIKGWDNIGYYQRVISELSGSKLLCVNSPDTDIMRDLGQDGARLYKEKLTTDYDDHIDFYFEELKIGLYNLDIRSKTDENANSIVTVVDCNGITTVLYSDIDVYESMEQRITKEIVSDYGKMDVVKMAHHGFNRSTSKETLDMIDPQFAIVCAETRGESLFSPFYGYLRDKGTILYRTSDQKDKTAIVEDMTDGLTIKTTEISNDHIVESSSINDWIWNSSPLWCKWYKDYYNFDWVYLNSEGYIQKNWKYINGKWYYLGQNGLGYDGWLNYKGDWYYIRECYMVNGEWVDGYWLSKNGIWEYKPRASWKKNKKGWWYGDTSGWYAKNIWQTIDGKRYYFNEEGYLE